ncbi:MAG: lysoplasmalogenase [Thermodesulfobacteriota bacterium]|nr:lysoplasmalogenase [Thermodesulfobacteriota bacterium]
MKKDIAYKREKTFILNKIIYLVFFSFAGLFLLTLNLRPYPFAYLIKSIPVLSLSLLAFFNIKGIKGKLIGIGLLFSGAGDIILELDRSGYFTYGLGAFLIAHIFYISAFISESELKRTRSLISLSMLAYCFIIGYFLIPNLGDMIVPVTAYLCVILAMGISASIGSSNHYLVVIGACFFILSDSIIAINRFLEPISYSSFWIMITYYPAQFLIAFGSSRKH